MLTYVGTVPSVSHKKKHFISLHKITWSISLGGTNSTKSFWSLPRTKNNLHDILPFILNK
jgi:hypothetical protein